MFGQKFKIIRDLLNVDQAYIAEILNISRPTYSRIESDKNDIGSTNLSLLFYKLQISPLWFFYDIEPIFFSFDHSESNSISKLLQTQAILSQVKQKIKTQGEKTFWQNIFDSFEGAFELFSKALNQDFSEISIQNAKEILINKIKEIKLNQYGFGINTYNKDKEKLIEFIKSLEDLECLVILTNAPQIINTINSSRLFLNKH